MTTGFHWLRALTQPEVTVSWSLQDWQRVIRLARRLRLLGRLAEAMVAAQLDGSLPPPVQQHLLAELRLSRYRLRTLSWTASQVRIALAGCAYPCVLLKGGAYAAQGLPIAPGRLPSDLDVLVPKASLADAQARLRTRGWEEVELDAHDRLYYSEWSHEVPPMRHPNFGMELDLHHTILPPVARTTVDADLLLARLQPSGLAHWQVLCPVDQVLHSAAHLFFDSELRDRLRDLVDLDGLLRHFAQRPGFWLELLQRAQQLGLAEPLALACHYTRKWLDTPAPVDLQRDISRCGPGPVRQAWLLPMFDAVLTPTEPDARPDWQQNLAATGLLARHHLLRMPLHLLLPHLWHKAKSRRRRLDDGDDGF
jgi:hypothetical protein